MTEPPPDLTLRMLRGTELRYVLTRILQLNGPSTVAELAAELWHWGFTVSGRPSKTISDALRWEIGHDRVLRRGRGVYQQSYVPRGTAYRIIARVAVLRKEVLSLRGGH